MKCPLCGCRFQEQDSQAACAGCPLTGTCHRVRCPNCGYDMPVEPKLVKALRAWIRRDNGTSGKS